MIRIGFDIGGSKIAALALDPQGCEVGRRRRDVPRDYGATLAALVEIVDDLVRAHGPAAAVGIAMPGMIGTDGGLIRAVNLPWVEGRPLRSDLELALALPVRVANDANCFALSEAIDVTDVSEPSSSAARVARVRLETFRSCYLSWPLFALRRRPRVGVLTLDVITLNIGP